MLLCMGRSTWGRLPLQEPLGQAAIVLASDKTWINGPLTL